MAIKVFFLAFLAIASIDLLIIFSENTSSNLISFFQQNLPQIIGNSNIFSVIFLTVGISTEFSNIFKGDNLIVIDATYDANLSQYLLKATEENRILNLYLDPNIIPTGSWQYHLHTSLQSQLLAIEEFLNYLGWSQIAMISTPSIDSIQISTDLEEDFDKKIKLKVSITDTLSSDNMNNIAGRLLKPNGMQNFIVFCEGNYIDFFVDSLVNKKIYKEGSGILIWSQGIWGGTYNGLLYIVEQGLESAKSKVEYEALAIKAFTDLVINYINLLSNNKNPNIDSILLKQILDENTINHRRAPNFFLVNIINNSKVIVGIVQKNKISLSSQIIYPGNSTAKPSISKPSILMSLTSSANEPDGTLNSYVPVIAQGNFFARDWINNSSLLLENFQVAFTENSCGTNVFIHEKALNCYTPLKNKLGFFFLGSDYTNSNLGVILLFRELNISMAHVDTAQTALFSNKTLFPEFMRVVSSNTYNAIILVKLFQSFGWKNVNVIYANASSAIPSYEIFLTEANKAGITIANDENKRMLPNNYVRAQFEDYKYVFQAVKDSKVRIFLTFQTAVSNYQSIEGLYDVGLRRGEIVVLLNSKTGGQATIQNYDQKYLPKILELLCGCISVSSVEYAGEFGTEIKNKMTSYWKSSPSFKGSHFDQTLLAAYGIDFTIKKGEDFENATILIKNTRAQRIIGASGTIAIDSTSNDRKFVILSINNFYASNQTGIYNESVAGYYMPTSNIPMQINSDIIWPGPSNVVPSDSIVLNSDCPFDEKLSENSTKGIAAFTVICFSLILLSFIITFILWKRGLAEPYPKLKEEREVQFADSFAMFTMVVEAFQYIDIGPKFEKYLVIEYLSSLSSFNIDIFISMKGFVYWLWLDIILGLICFWLTNCFVSLTRNQDWIDKIFLFRWLFGFKEFVIPLLGNTFFVAIINSLLSVLKCAKSTGNDLEESYMDIDCHEFCWQGTHLAYAIICIFVLLLYLLLSILLRPIWSNLKEEQNIRCQPKYLVIKSAVQVLYISLNQAISIYSHNVQGFIYLVLIIVFVVHNIKNPPYNYDRMNMWQVVLLCCVGWSVLLASISSALKSLYLELMIIKIAGWTVMIGFGLALQNAKFPGLLIRQHAPGITHLFRFMLTSTVSADSISREKIKYSAVKYQMEKEKEIAPPGSTRICNYQLNIDKADGKMRLDVAEESMRAEQSSNNIIINFEE